MKARNLNCPDLGRPTEGRPPVVSGSAHHALYGVNPEVESGLYSIENNQVSPKAGVGERVRVKPDSRSPFRPNPPYPLIDSPDYIARLKGGRDNKVGVGGCCRGEGRMIRAT